MLPQDLLLSVRTTPVDQVWQELRVTIHTRPEFARQERM